MQTSSESVADPLNPPPELFYTEYHLSGVSEHGKDVYYICSSLKAAKERAAEVLPRGGEVIAKVATFRQIVVDMRPEQAHDKLINACIYLRNQYGRNATEQARRILTDAARSI